ncbi:hypothetical protein [Cytobacillus horneckiae]|uniref:hypothetical protein n=1 Tax=Cytobacillus horneckiae TaxID=549687 RepID=UPI00203E48E1|nr:hypothetical protein [Cytobacillus horneckiae]MCM3180202.1 hypothetical protein [Cytobacillus horneckiae]
MLLLDDLLSTCKWCNGTGNDGFGICPDCECTGFKGGKYAEEVTEAIIENHYENSIKNKES